MMDDVIETERLLLLPLTREHLDEVVAMHEDPLVLRFIGELPRDEAIERLEASEREWAERGYGRTAIIERATGRFVGRAGLKFWPQFEETEAGWNLTADARGKGYATEASRATIEWGLANFEFPYVTAMIEPANERSRAVAERLAMTPLREDVLMDRPVVVHALHRHR